MLRVSEPCQLLRACALVSGNRDTGGVLSWVKELQVLIFGNRCQQVAIVRPFETVGGTLESLEGHRAFLLRNIPHTHGRIQTRSGHGVVTGWMELGEDEFL